MINIKKLTEKDIGRWVECVLQTNGKIRKKIGVIKFWGKKDIFVVYKWKHWKNFQWKNFYNYTALPTRPQDLNFIKKRKITIRNAPPSIKNWQGKVLWIGNNRKIRYITFKEVLEKKVIKISSDKLGQLLDIPSELAELIQRKLKKSIKNKDLEKAQLLYGKKLNLIKQKGEI